MVCLVTGNSEIFGSYFRVTLVCVDTGAVCGKSSVADVSQVSGDFPKPETRYFSMSAIVQLLKRCNALSSNCKTLICVNVVANTAIDIVTYCAIIGRVFIRVCVHQKKRNRPSSSQRRCTVKLMSSHYCLQPVQANSAGRLLFLNTAFPFHNVLYIHT